MTRKLGDSSDLHLADGHLPKEVKVIDSTGIRVLAKVQTTIRDVACKCNPAGV